MKKDFLLLVLFAAGILMLCYLPITAGDYHNDPIDCSNCHVMHASLSGGDTTFNAGAGYGKLLKAANTNALCLRCHSQDGPDYTAATPAVADYTGTDSPSGGGFSLYDGSGNVYTAVNTPSDYRSTKGHDLEVAPPAVGTYRPPGFDATDNWRGFTSDTALNCATCHEPHGDTVTFRNLKRDPNPKSSGANEIDGVLVRATTNSGNYRDSDVWKNANYKYDSDVTRFCQDCHEKFGPTNATADGDGIISVSAEDYDQEGLADNAQAADDDHHPVDMEFSGEVEYTGGYNANTGTDTLPLYRNGTNRYVMCLTCHRAHGSTNDSALRWSMSDAGFMGGSSGCQICHEK